MASRARRAALLPGLPDPDIWLRDLRRAGNAGWERGLEARPPHVESRARVAEPSVIYTGPSWRPLHRAPWTVWVLLTPQTLSSGTVSYNVSSERRMSGGIKRSKGKAPNTISESPLAVCPWEAAMYNKETICLGMIQRVKLSLPDLFLSPQHGIAGGFQQRRADKTQ